MILVLNGASSSGKTTLSRELQKQWSRPLLHFGTDWMIASLPASYVGMKASARPGIEFINDKDEQGPIVRAKWGEVAQGVQASFAMALRVLAEEGHDLVLDLVLDDPVSLRSYVRAFQGLRTYFIGVRCELSVLEEREAARGDRFLNLARSQHLAVHELASSYDLEVDTTASGPHQLATTITEYVSANEHPEAFERLALDRRLTSACG